MQANPGRSLRLILLFAVAITWMSVGRAGDDENKATLEKLDKRTTLEKGIEPNTTLSDGLKFLSDRFGLRIDIDVAAFKAAGQVTIGDSPVRMRPLKDVQAAAVLRILLPHVAASYTVSKDRIVVVPAKLEYREFKKGDKRFEVLTSDWNKLIPPVSSIKRAQAEKEVRRKLQQMISLPHGIAKNTTLSDALGTILGQKGTNFEFDNSTFPFETEPFNPLGGRAPMEEYPVQLRAIQESRLDRVLEQVLDQVEASYIVYDSTVIIRWQNKKKDKP